MKRIVALLAVATLAVSPILAQDTTAQEAQTQQQEEGGKKKRSKFGSFIRKAGEVATGINMTDEVFIVNPNPTDLKVEFVKAWGDPSTGRVSVRFKVRPAKVEYNSGTFGGNTSGNGKTIAIGADGKTYDVYDGAAYESVALTQGVFSEVTLTGRCAFKNVQPSLASMEVMKISFYLTAGTRGLLEFRNVPIDWNPDPEELQ
jgi:hypothetical protein